MTFQLAHNIQENLIIVLMNWYKLPRAHLWIKGPDSEVEGRTVVVNFQVVLGVLLELLLGYSSNYPRYSWGTPVIDFSSTHCWDCHLQGAQTNILLGNCKFTTSLLPCHPQTLWVSTKLNCLLISATHP